jgi:SAM-dependent methyltransferase
MVVEQYNSNDKAKKYDLFKKNSFLTRIDRPSIHKLLENDLHNKRVIDLGCGTGDSTRMLQELKPKQLIGVDISTEMIKTAIEFNDKSNLTQYFVKDCAVPLNLGKFDVVFAAHLLNNATSEEDLMKFYKCMYDCTREGGVACGIMMNVFLEKKILITPGKYRKYGVEYFMNGDNVVLDIQLFYQNEYLFDIRNWLWPPELHEKCARDCGFSKIEWIRPSLDEHYDDHEGFFDTFLEFPPTILYKFTK